MGIRCADHVTPLYPQKLALTSSTGGGRSVGIVRSRTKATKRESPIFVHCHIRSYVTCEELRCTRMREVVLIYCVMGKERDGNPALSDIFSVIGMRRECLLNVT